MDRAGAPALRPGPAARPARLPRPLRVGLLLAPALLVVAMLPTSGTAVRVVAGKTPSATFVDTVPGP